MYLSPAARLAIYVEGEFGKRSKTAEGLLRYGKNPIAAVIDSTCAGKLIKEVVGIDSSVPIVSSVKESLAYKPDALLLGMAYNGGRLPENWRQDIKEAIAQGMDIVNGLHDMLSDDPEMIELARKHETRLIDVRRAPEDLPMAEGLARKVDAFVVLTVGTDCSVGKMTTSLEILACAEQQGFKSAFVATGQTGIMIAGGKGIAIDRVIGDFMAGATEQMVLDCAPGNDFVFVEGQGSLAHPGCSGVTLALMHGSCAPAMVLCHKVSRKTINHIPDFPQPDLRKIIEGSHAMAEFVQPSKVVAIALNTQGLDESTARAAVAQAQQQTGLPVSDPVRFGAKPLFDAVLAYRDLVTSRKKQGDRPFADALFLGAYWHAPSHTTTVKPF